MRFLKTQRRAGEVDFDNLPRHIAIIMDGNGRWAKKRGLPRTAGHAEGAETFRSIATYCKEIGIEYLTVYAFSTENWKRPAEEVSSIMNLLEKYLCESIERMERDNVKMKFFGDITPLSPKLRQLIERTCEISTHYDGCQVNICLNYGGRDEILRAAKLCAESYAAGNADAFSEDVFSSNLWSAGIPDPEIIIRPGGEKRLSNFLLWQSAYSELYFTDTLWPDFSKEDINCAIAWFQGRERRFGGI
ncbi:MAG: di-trans,poly-cis-decaprenylcistransferase [Clostridiales bacterium]|nr:di-trans,poly-cis-decaprenylcistransferase [Clostridiales bacterium]